MKLRFFIYSCLLAIASVSCERGSKEPYVEPEESTGKFSLSIEQIDGTRGSTRVYTLPELNFIINSDDEKQLYSLEYSIDNGEKQTVGSLVPNKEFNINYELYALTEYGSHVINGKIYNAKDPSNYKSFERIIWMKYITTTTSAPFIITHSGRQIKDELIVPINNDGQFCLPYSPEESFVVCEIKSSDSSIIDFDSSSISCMNGTWTIPYHTGKIEGDAVVILRFSNGDDSSESKYIITTSADIEEVDLEADFIAQSFIITEANTADVETVLEITVGKSDSRCDVEYRIDDILVKTESDVPPRKKIRTTLPDVNRGEHSISVIIKNSQGYKNMLTLSSTFMIGNVDVTIEDEDGEYNGSTKPFGTDQSMRIHTAYKYDIILSGIGDQYLKYFTLKNDSSGTDEIANTSTGWKLTPGYIGKGNLIITLNDGIQSKTHIIKTTRVNGN